MARGELGEILTSCVRGRREGGQVRKQRRLK